MIRVRNILIFSVSAFTLCAPAVQAETVESGDAATANTMELPAQILKTGVTLNSTNISPNSMQLADNIGLTPILAKIQTYRSSLSGSASSSMAPLERVELRQNLVDARQQAMLMIQRTMLEIDFVLSEITAEDEVYQEILSTFASRRDKTLALTNAASFVSNGALWTIGEALAIPTWKRPKYSISAGTVSIFAGIIPSLFSLYTLKAVNGPKKRSETEPNMLAKVFDYPTTPEIDYPDSVWRFLTQSPATGGKARYEQLIDRWIADSNISGFTDRKSRQQLDVITASVSRRKALSIATLTTRSVMLEQLAAEVYKMKKMLLELNMAVSGDKQLLPS